MSGGVRAFNNHMCRQLSRHFDIRFNGPFHLKHDIVPQYYSKIKRRILRLPGNFDFFSTKRLIANAMSKGCLAQMWI